MKQYAEAIKDFTQAIKLDPEHVKAYNNRGVSYSNLKQYGKAVEDIKKAAELDPGESIYRENLEICRRLMRIKK